MSKDLVPPCFPPPNPLLLMILSGRVSSSLVHKHKGLRDFASASLNRLYQQTDFSKHVSKLATYLQEDIPTLNPAAPPFVPKRWPDRKELLPDISVSLLSRRQDLAYYSPKEETAIEDETSAEDLLPSLTYHPNALIDNISSAEDHEQINPMPIRHYSSSTDLGCPDDNTPNRRIVTHADATKPPPYPIYKPIVEPVYKSRSAAYWSLRVRIDEEQELNLRKQDNSLQQLAVNSLNFHHDQPTSTSFRTLILPRNNEHPHGAWYSQLYPPEPRKNDFRFYILVTEIPSGDDATKIRQRRPPIIWRRTR